MIKNFTQFMNESESQDFTVSDIFSTLTRNYETNKMFYTDLLQFVVKEERRDWGDIRQKAELEKEIVEDADYKLVFRLDEKEYVLKIEFSISYKGRKEKDAPETASPSDLERLNVVLESVKIQHIHLESANMHYSTKSPSDSVKKSCEKFLVKMLEVDYDTQGEKIYSIEQQN